MAAASPCSTYFAAASYMNPEDHVSIQTFRMLLRSRKFRSCHLWGHVLRPAISDFWIQADTPSGSGGCLQVTKSEHPPKTLSQPVNTPGNEPVCPEPSELDVSGGAGPQASVLRL